MRSRAPRLLSGSQAPPEKKVIALASHARDSMTNGFEIAGTVLIFSLLGWFIDRRFDSAPWFMMAFVFTALLAQFAKLYYVYNAQMVDLESKRREMAKS